MAAAEGRYSPSGRLPGARGQGEADGTGGHQWLGQKPGNLTIQRGKADCQARDQTLTGTPGWKGRYKGEEMGTGHHHPMAARGNTLKSAAKGNQ